METTGKPTGRRGNVLRWIGIVAAVLALLRLVPLAWHFGRDRLSDAPRVTISKETTYATSPLREDGYVDYFAAVNGIGAKGVDSQNNAAVLLIAVLGCEECEDEAVKRQLFDLLEIEPAERNAEYREFDDFFDVDLPEANADSAGRDPWARQMIAMERPWSEEEFPIVHQWIRENDAAIDKIVEASRRTRYHVPLLADDDDPTLIEGLMPTLASVREAGRSLIARAMLRVAEGDHDGALDDLLACHRLGRLVGQGPTLIDWLVGIAIDGMANEADIAMAHYAKLDAGQIDAYRKRLQQLIPPRPVQEKFVAERFMCLDAVCRMARGESFGEEASGRVLSSFNVDFDAVLTSCNVMYDRLLDIGGMTDRRQRVRAVQALDDELSERSRAARSPLTVIKQYVFGSRRAAARNLADLMCALFIPAIGSACDAGDRQAMTLEMVDTALALAAYRLDQGDYPESLGALTPKYRDAAPDDVFGTGVIRYAREEDGYVLYSVGPDGEDNGGDLNEDFGFRVPVSDGDMVN